MRPSQAILLLVSIVTFWGSLVSSHHYLLLLAGSVLIGGVLLLWSSKEIPLLLLPFALQWLSVSLKPLETAITGASLDSLAERGASLEPAVVFALIALSALAIGMRLGSRASTIHRSASLAAEATKWPERYVLSFSIGAIILGHLLEKLAYSFGPAVQIVLALSGVKLAGLFFLTFWCQVRRRRLGLLTVIAISETLIGLTGYFSAAFLAPLLVMTLAGAAARPRVTLRGVLIGLIAASMIFSVCVFWSAIKPQYRSFLSGGLSDQNVVQPLDMRLGYLLTAVTDFDQDQFKAGIDALVRRQSYIDFLAHTMEYVPANVPHEHGSRVLETFIHVVTPRILFPNKPPLPSDTVVTSRYTGLTFDEYRLTSISIGYLGELYVDFGVLGAIIAVLVLGIGVGRLHSVILSNPATPLMVNVALAAMTVLPLMYFETALIKIIGGTLMGFAAALLLQRMTSRRLKNVLRAGAVQVRHYQSLGISKGCQPR